MINFYRGWRYSCLERERKWRNGLFEPITTPTLMIWGRDDFGKEFDRQHTKLCAEIYR